METHTEVIDNMGRRYEVRVPPRLRRRPQFRGMAVPWVVMYKTDGTPDFATLDVERKVQAIAGRWCGLCGQVISKSEDVYFSGGEGAAETGLYVDPGMHRTCAEYANEVCPFINGTHRQYREVMVKEDKIPAGMAIKEILMGTVSPAQVLVKCKRYVAVRLGEDVLAFAQHRTEVCRTQAKPSYTSEVDVRDLRVGKGQE
jgi:hypothetical protein